MRSLIASLAAVLSLSTPSLSFPFLHRRQVQSCNGAPELCATQYSAVSSAIGAHDSGFVGALPQQNQNVRPAQQLERGARMMQVQTHKDRVDENIVHMCHTDCFLEDAGPLADWLGEIRQFMETPGRENEVVTILLTNPEGIPMTSYDDAFKFSGLDRFVFVPGNGEAQPLQLKSWPTLGAMIQAGKRIVVFIDAGANTNEIPYILDEFAYFFETPFEGQDFTDCRIDRPLGATADGRMYIANHHPDAEIAPNVFVPDRFNADATNSRADVDKHFQRCKDLYGGIAPNFMLLDFVDRGDWSAIGVPRPDFGEQAGNAADGLCDSLFGGVGVDCNLF